MHVITFSMLGALPEEGMHLGKKKQKKGKEAMKETTPKELTDEVDEEGLT